MKALFTALIILSAHFVHGQNTAKALALNEAGSAIMQLMDRYPEFNTRQNFHAALGYLEEALIADPEHPDVIQNIGNCYYKWTLTLAKRQQTEGLNDAQFNENHTAMETYTQRSMYFLQKHRALTGEDVPATDD